MRRSIVLVTLVGLFICLGAALGGTGDEAPPTDATAVFTTSTSVPTISAVTLALSATRVEYGDRVVASGSTQPALPDATLALELLRGAAWTPVSMTTTDASGAFHVEFRAGEGGTLRARELGTGAVSELLSLSVAPKVRVKAGPGVAFRGARVSAWISPATYAGRATLTLKHDGQVVARASARVGRGRLRANVPLPGVGRFSVVLSLPEAPGLSATFAAARIFAQGRTLSAGSSGQDVRALSLRLAQLAVRVPGISTTFSSALTDSVLAFQKAFELPRTGVVGPETWRMLARAQALEPRYRTPSSHLEIDKTRQILLVVLGGKVSAVLPVSSGATGNTPEGRHRIRWKAPATTTWLGPGILYRTLTFYGNSFAIHGWPFVPPYPASHGCVRIPMWTADWLYNQSPVGETVYVY